MKYIPLNQGKFAIVDDEDYDRLMQWKWYVCRLGYAIRHVKKSENKNKSTEMMHREILQNLEDLEPDHINRDKLDNRKSNLRRVTRSQNCINQAIKKNNTSGYKGITKRCSRHTIKIWRARIGVNGKRIHVGDYETLEDAAKAYNMAAIIYHGDFAYKNEVSS